MSNLIFKRVQTLQPKRSIFDLSYEKKFTCDMGELIPVMCDEAIPGDFMKFGCQAVIRFQPLVAPVLHQVDMYYHIFFVPNRIMWNGTGTDNWETYITGGVSGDEAPTHPVWDVTDDTAGSLWDYLGFPVNVDPGAGARPVDWPRRAYNMVFNAYYRDENLQTEVALTNENILIRNWEKDYFTSALTEQQRGTAPSLPISGTSSAVWTNTNVSASGIGSPYSAAVTNANDTDHIIYMGGANAQHNMLAALNANTVDLSSATTFDIADLRLAFQIQKWMERNNRAGVRYTEFLKVHFNVSPTDDRLQRPEYIGGCKVPIIFSEVLQTSETATTPQGTLAGHGLSVASTYCGKYHCQENGVYIGIMSVMPKPAYQQGINRQWLKQTKYDYVFPEFVNLSEQAITMNEIYSVDGDPTTNNSIFGYQGRYDEHRTKQNMVVGEMRDTFDYWHLGRIFGSAPSLNEAFIKCIPDKRIFADQVDPGLIVSFGNVIRALRPLPIMAEPGFIDHN